MGVVCVCVFNITQHKHQKTFLFFGVGK